MQGGDLNKHLFILLGPTAVGKTDLSIEIAQSFKTEILSMDSRQFYKELTIGTAKPEPDQLFQVKHHFIDSLSIHNEYSVGKFETEAISVLDELFRNHDVVIGVGGSGLFIQAVCEGMDEMPSIAPGIRDKWIKRFEAEGIETLQQELKKADPEYYEIVDLQNPQRLIRALEVWEGTGKPFSSFRKRKTAQRPFAIHKIGLDMDRERLYERINSRMDQMIEQGLFEEAKEFYQFKELNALQTVGYSEIFGYLDGNYDKEEAIRLLKRNSRRYAKRQLTWFRKDPDITWFNPGDNIQAWIEEKLDKTN